MQGFLLKTFFNADETGLFFTSAVKQGLQLTGQHKSRWKDEQSAYDYPGCSKHGWILPVEAVHDWQKQVAALHEKLQEPLYPLWLQQKGMGDTTAFLRMAPGLGRKLSESNCRVCLLLDNC